MELQFLQTAATDGGMNVQRVTNSILLKDGHVLLLKKPSRGWWVPPGGKMELRESIQESAVREYKEETGIDLKNPRLRGIFTIVIENESQVINEWMLFTFQSEDYSGKRLASSPEGELDWIPVHKVAELPMAPGDYYIFEHMLNKEGMIYGTFIYTEAYELISCRLQAEGEPVRQI